MVNGSSIKSRIFQGIFLQEYVHVLVQLAMFTFVLIQHESKKKIAFQTNIGYNEIKHKH